MRKDTFLYWERRPVEIRIQSYISDAVRDECATQSLSYKLVSERSGIALSHFYNRLANKTRWTVEDVYRVASVLDVSLTAIMPTMEDVFPLEA